MRIIRKNWILILVGLLFWEHSKNKESVKGSYFQKLTGFFKRGEGSGGTGFKPNTLDPNVTGVNRNRQSVLIQNTRNLFEAMKGIGVRKNVFFDAILSPNTDEEFEFMEGRFLEISGGTGMRKMISKQLLITRSDISGINDEFERRGMAVKLSA